MSRRIEIELTSKRDETSWTWRAAGAKLPKGILESNLLADTAKIGDVLKVDADFSVDGITILSVVPDKQTRVEPQRLEITGRSTRFQDGVTTALASKKKFKDSDDKKKRSSFKKDRNEDPKNRKDSNAPRGPIKEKTPRTRTENSSPAKPRVQRAPQVIFDHPKPKRLKPGRKNRNALLESLPEAHKPIAEELLRGGIPAVRQGIERQNKTLREQGKTEIKPDALLEIAEKMMPSLRTAEWRDKAEAALEHIADLDLRDLRSVVVASEAAARDDETRALAQQLRDGLTQRVEHEQQNWLAELSEALQDGRLIRALRLSSRPPKAGSLLPAELTQRLISTTTANLTKTTSPQRYATVLDALAFSPIRLLVVAAELPSQSNDELLAVVKKCATQLPQIAQLFGITTVKKEVKPLPPKPGAVAENVTPQGITPESEPADVVSPAGVVPAENDETSALTSEPSSEEAKSE